MDHNFGFDLFIYIYNHNINKLSRYVMKRLANVAKRGCPECMSKGAAKCKNCQGKTWMFDWYKSESGEWEHIPGQAKK
jgi:hypothetical protein